MSQPLDAPSKRRWFSIHPQFAHWFHLALLGLYVVEVVRHRRDFESWLSGFGVSDPRAVWLLIATPVLLYGIIYWSRRRREAHQSPSAPNNRWRGP